MLAELDQDCANHIAAWMTALVWLSYDVSASYSQLTSSSFPILPHCAFVTDKANRHIPPDTVVDRDSIYFLAENLYHEALHLELSATLLLTDVVSDSYESSEARRIQIPWRGQSWEPDRIVHAAYVYANILRLRIKAVRAGVIEPGLGESAMETGLGALKYLSSKLDNCGEMFTDQGKDLLLDIKRQSQQTAYAG